LLFLATGCPEDVAGSDTFGEGETEGKADSAVMPTGDTGMDSTTGDSAGSDSSDPSGGSTGGDGDTDGDPPEPPPVLPACEPVQAGLCEIPGQMAPCYSAAIEGCDVGACRPGTQTCDQFDLDLGQWSECMGEVLPSVEICDGIDNDCDGQIDEELPEATCGLNQCQHTEATCIDGEANVCDPLVGADTEVCDGADNDCDGDIDENLGDMVVQCGVGQCDHTVTGCVEGQVPTCDPLEGASMEVCDGLDNDCDDQTDEDLGTQSCGMGACFHSEPNCQGGQFVTCDPFEGMSMEVCDAVDNDCDGVVDDGFGQVTCGQGICEHTIDQCVNGVPQVCNPTQGAVTEVCGDGLDNDCDGSVDEMCACMPAPVNPANLSDNAPLSCGDTLMMSWTDAGFGSYEVEIDQNEGGGTTWTASGVSVTGNSATYTIPMSGDWAGGGAFQWRVRHISPMCGPSAWVTQSFLTSCVGECTPLGPEMATHYSHDPNDPPGGGGCSAEYRAIFTTVCVNAGDTLDIQVSGSTNSCCNAPACPDYGEQNCSSDSCCTCEFGPEGGGMVMGCNIGEAVCRIGGSSFDVGIGGMFTAPATGCLECGSYVVDPSNDQGCLHFTARRLCP
jgi:hypothetical protein